ncbi:MAG: hypothetical protein KatS3mg097_458 [Candidatus Parcubacteria bacterium]|nr:MAG: hypothetical protein KatS3mg097_458 [Candidatus Parcubacteria bacterium]
MSNLFKALNKISNYLLIFSILIFIIIGGVFIFMLFKNNNINIAGLSLTITGPTIVNSFEISDYIIQIDNQSNQRLEDVSLKVFLSEGAFFYDQKSIKERVIPIGIVEAKNIKKQSLGLFFVNAGEMNEKIKVVLNYKISGKEYSFEKGGDLNVKVNKAPIQANIFLPNKIYINQPFQLSINLFNLTKEKFNNIKVNIEPAFGFQLIDAFPKSNIFYWEFPVLDQNDTKQITINGYINDIRSDGIFKVKIYFDFENQSFALDSQIAKTTVVNNPIVFTIRSTPNDNVVDSGANISYEVTIENKSETIMSNNEVKVTFSGLFDFDSINSSGYLSRAERAIIWNGRNKPELLNLKPNDKVVINFSASILKTLPIFNPNNDKNFTAKVRVDFRSPTIPIEVEKVEKEYAIFQEDVKKIKGSAELTHSLTYNEGLFPTIGSFPPIHEAITNFAWHVKIKTKAEDFSELNLNAKFPPGVNLTNKVSGDATIENLKFDPQTGIFNYTLNKIAANAGYRQDPNDQFANKEIDLVFEVIVDIPANADPQNFVVIPEVNFSLKGDFSQRTISGSLQPLTTANVTNITIPTP